MEANGHPSRDVCHVHEESCVDTIGHLSELREVQVQWISRPAGDDHSGPVFKGKSLDFGHINAEIGTAHALGDDSMELAVDAQPHPVGPVATVGQVEPENRFTQIEQSLHRGSVSLYTRMRLNVRVTGVD